MSQIEPLHEELEKIMIPTNFVKLFDSDYDFIKWCRVGSVKDLECTLNEFKQYEKLYEYCAVIVSVIKEKTLT